MQPSVILGPQRHEPTAAQGLAALGVEHGIVALVTAGWEERESETIELAEHLGRPVRSLGLFQRSEVVLREDAELRAAWARLRRRLREQDELYRIRLAGLEDTLVRLHDHGASAARRAPEIEGTLAMLRALDDHQTERVAELHDAFVAGHDLARRPSIAPHREAIEAEIAESDVVALAGGDVTVILHMLRLFQLEPMLEEKPLVAWSAGAMVLGERILLFHDDPPWGEGGARVNGPGLGRIAGTIFLPHAQARLRMGDAERVARLAARMAPRTLVPLESGEGVLLRAGARVPLGRGVRRIAADGSLQRWTDGGVPA